MTLSGGGVARHLVVVGSPDHDITRLTDVIFTTGHAIYQHVTLALQAGDDMVLAPVVRGLTDRELGAASLYAADQADHHMVGLLTFEEGRRCGLAEANGPSPVVA
jgi:hypothetical protein